MKYDILYGIIGHHDYHSNSKNLLETPFARLKRFELKNELGDSILLFSTCDKHTMMEILAMFKIM